MTCDVFKLIIFNDFKDLQPKNISAILETEDVSKFDKSKEVNEQHPLNKESKLLFKAKSKLYKSNDSRDEHS